MGTVIFDIDGVLLDFTGAFLDFACNKFADGTSYTEEQLEYYDYRKLDPRLNLDLVREFQASDSCKNLKPLFDGFKEFLEVRRDPAVSQVILSTDFPAEYAENRIKNLVNVGIGASYDEIHFQSKEKILDLYGDSLIAVYEDSPRWITYYAERGISVRVPTRSYLRHYDYTGPNISRY